MESETPEQRAARIFKEDEEKQNKDHQQELDERRLKRMAVVEKHKNVLDAMIIGKQKAIRWRNHFHKYVFAVSQMSFKTSDQEYDYIGKPGRLYWNDYDERLKAFNKKDPMHKVIDEIMREFGCYDY